MKYAGIIDNDIADSITGLAVSFWTQGCPHHCKGCHNPETWSFNEGSDLPENYIEILKEKLNKNGLLRNLSILGGEPLCKENKELTFNIIKNCKGFYKDSYLWTGYEVEELKGFLTKEELEIIKKNVDYLIVGRFDINKRDLKATLRGSTNQQILRPKKEKIF